MSEHVWNAPPLRRQHEDSFAFGEPFDADRLPYRFDWSRTFRRATGEFFVERDPARPIGVTLAKVVGVIFALAGIALLTLGTVAALGVWTIKAVLG